MRGLAWASLIVGIIFLAVAFAMLSGNDDLALGGPAVLPNIIAGNWRLLIGLALWVGAVAIVAAWIAFRRLPGLAWLSMLVLVFLFVGYLAAGLVTSAGALIAAIVVGGIVLPLGVAAIASAIGSAVMRRRARMADRAV
jgi:hypothetical protein